ncbi:radical SAM protein [Amycolatopsis sp. EV170708-02-1]|uniref:radical SAM protein n=1 Tax=Amycolatopsis sp. EV170708-02-1 TaxID=2919322 RepID=UPI001F0C4A7A|nr:radical SAM protein [Amycolatopsis sp. EV170708-02-1]UMP06981.1 radical SAM protein [Amycolatopsis sp. EV170708-02-1]
MAGAKNGNFSEKISPYLRQKMSSRRGGGAPKFLTLQYAEDPLEKISNARESPRYYQSEVHATFEGEVLRGVEKLYRRTLLVEPTTICAAHCRWCIRGQCDTLTLSNDDLERIARYCGTAPENADVREILVTGGDPLILVDRVDFLLDSIERHATDVEVVRIATRVPLQDPRRVDKRMLHALRPRSTFRIEIATHINHPGELFPEVREAYAALQTAGARIYDQTVLLRGVNDEPETLVELFDELRHLDIEAHYLFHCSPIRGMDHHRTSIARGLDLFRQLSCSGKTSGRVKPQFALMTDVGKVSLCEGSIIGRDKDRVLLKTGYSYGDRLRWVPTWTLPASASVGGDGFLQVWYLDADEKKA